MQIHIIRPELPECKYGSVEVWKSIAQLISCLPSAGLDSTGGAPGRTGTAAAGIHTASVAGHTMLSPNQHCLTTSQSLKGSLPRQNRPTHTASQEGILQGTTNGKTGGNPGMQGRVVGSCRDARNIPGSPQGRLDEGLECKGKPRANRGAGKASVTLPPPLGRAKPSLRQIRVRVGCTNNRSKGWGRDTRERIRMKSNTTFAATPSLYAPLRYCEKHQVNHAWDNKPHE